MLSRIVSRSLSVANSTNAHCAATIGGLCEISRRYFAEKGEERVAGRLDGLLMTRKQLDEATQKGYDEEGNYTPPNAHELPHMSRRDVMMNIRIPPLGIVPPPFGEEQIKEITDKTTITRDNIEWVRKHWTDTTLSADQKNYEPMVEDILEMYKKGVSFASINLWIDYVTGCDIGCPHAVYNRNWARIDS